MIKEDSGLFQKNLAHPLLHKRKKILLAKWVRNPKLPNRVVIDIILEVKLGRLRNSNRNKLTWKSKKNRKKIGRSRSTKWKKKRRRLYNKNQLNSQPKDLMNRHSQKKQQAKKKRKSKNKTAKSKKNRKSNKKFQKIKLRKNKKTMALS